MASGVKWLGWVEATLAFAATATMLYFGSGLDPLWPLMWVAPLPVLWFATRGGGWWAALVAGLASLAGAFAYWEYFRQLGLPAVAWLGGFGVAAIVFALAVSLFRALLLRNRGASAVLAFPATWVTFEYARNLLWPHGTAGSLAYSQLHFLPFLQLASLTGPWGMTFVLLLFPADLAAAWQLRREARKAGRVLLLSAGTVAAVLIFGWIRLTLPQPGPEVRIVLAASDAQGNQNVATAGAKTQALVNAYVASLRKLDGSALRNVQAIVLPEKLGRVTDDDVAEVDAILQKLAEQSGATVVAGFDRQSGAVVYNQARVYEPGAAVRSYDKQHLLPPFELKFTPGRELLLLPHARNTWGVEICKDMDFTGLSRRYGRAGVGLVLAPAWDFNVDRAWHGHIAVMRGVEDGFSVARAAKDGFLTVSNNRGKILGETRSDSAPFAMMMVTVPAGHSWTLFQQMGDWFAWLAIALLLFVSCGYGRDLSRGWRRFDLPGARERATVG
jgi:apolipoprotein N-acyltransferase